MRHALALIACLSLPAASLAASSINRCVDASGNTVFTDRDCSAHAARDMPRSGSAPGSATTAQGALWSGTHGLLSGRLPHPQSGCAADPAELAIRLRAALESRDVNQLSSLYHWPGASSRGADSVLASLARTAAKGVYAVAVEPVAAQGPATAMAMASAAAVAPPPGGLRVEHGPGGFEGYTPETTTFAMTRHMGCWWIRY
jgi:hypothetical protein